jgi:hypothetical protein
MTCERIEEHLSGLIDRELDPQTTEEVHRHLANCSACRQEFEELRLIVQQSAALPLLEPPDRLYWTIRNQARNAPPRPWFAPRKIGWVLVPALATAALLLVLFPGKQPADVKTEVYARAPATDTGRPAVPSAEPTFREPLADSREPSAVSRQPVPRRMPGSEMRSSVVRAEPEIVPVASSPMMSATAVQPVPVAQPLPAASSEVLASMRSIQQALEEIEAALQENPGNVQVQVAYRVTYQKGMELRQRYVLGAR